MTKTKLAAIEAATEYCRVRYGHKTHCGDWHSAYRGGLLCIYYRHVLIKRGEEWIA